MPNDWRDLSHLRADLETAIEAAYKAGTLNAWDALVLYLTYIQDWACPKVAEHLQQSVSKTRRDRDRALRALRDTGLLKGYQK